MRRSHHCQTSPPGRVQVPRTGRALSAGRETVWRPDTGPAVQLPKNSRCHLSWHTDCETHHGALPKRYGGGTHSLLRRRPTGHGGSRMLVLTRRVGEVIYIDSEIVVKVAEIRGNRVKLAIDAPDHVRVDRKEVRDRSLVAAETYQGES